MTWPQENYHPLSNSRHVMGFLGELSVAVLRSVGVSDICLIYGVSEQGN